MRWIGGQESTLLRASLASVHIERPVYICGLARAGSTMLLELFSQLEAVATHRYRDFPFTSIPIFWNKFLDRVSVSASPVERPHRDRIMITRESPEAMEEPLWIAWFPDLHRSIQAVDSYPQFNRFADWYRDHVRKLLLLRHGRRYVAKNNYHSQRIEAITRIFPDAQFVVPIRHPISQVQSLVRQHQLFINYAREDTRVARTMAASGHFEFGPQRQPIGPTRLARDEIQQAWASGNDWLGYAMQWRNVYGDLQETIERSAELRQRIHVCRYEDFCDAPEQRFGELRSLTGFDVNGDSPPSLEHISPAQGQAQTLTPTIRRTIWTTVAAIADCYGYRCDSDRGED